MTIDSTWFAEPLKAVANNQDKLDPSLYDLVDNMVTYIKAAYFTDGAFVDDEGQEAVVTPQVMENQLDAVAELLWGICRDSKKGYAILQRLVEDYELLTLLPLAVWGYIPKKAESDAYHDTSPLWLLLALNDEAALFVELLIKSPKFLQTDGLIDVLTAGQEEGVVAGKTGLWYLFSREAICKAMLKLAQEHGSVLLSNFSRLPAKAWMSKAQQAPHVDDTVLTMMLSFPYGYELFFYLLKNHPDCLTGLSPEVWNTAQGREKLTRTPLFWLCSEEQSCLLFVKSQLLHKIPSEAWSVAAGVETAEHGTTPLWWLCAYSSVCLELVNNADKYGVFLEMLAYLPSSAWSAGPRDKSYHFSSVFSMLASADDGIALLELLLEHNNFLVNIDPEVWSRKEAVDGCKGKSAAQLLRETPKGEELLRKHLPMMHVSEPNFEKMPPGFFVNPGLGNTSSAENDATNAEIATPGCLCC